MCHWERTFPTFPMSSIGNEIWWRYELPWDYKVICSSLKCQLPILFQSLTLRPSSAAPTSRGSFELTHRGEYFHQKLIIINLLSPIRGYPGSSPLLGLHFPAGCKHRIFDWTAILADLGTVPLVHKPAIGRSLFATYQFGNAQCVPLLTH